MPAFFLLLLFSSAVVGQSITPTFISVEPDQLSSAFVKCILKDSRGFIWFGTESGLMRYDGTNLIKYEHNPEDVRSLPYNTVNAILEDDSHSMWIGTSQGLALYNPELDNFIDVDSIPGNANHLSHRYVTSLQKDGQGKIWIGTHGNGIDVYDPKKLKFTYLREQQSGDSAVPSNLITSMLILGDTTWVSTKRGLKLFNTNNLSELHLKVTDPDLNSRELTEIKKGPQGDIWIATAAGKIIQICLDSSIRINHVSQISAPGSTVLTMCHDRNGNLWVGGYNTGLNYLDVKTGTVTRYLPREGDAKMLATNSIRTIYIDDSGITWIGTHNRGAYMIDNHAKKFLTWQRNAIATSTLLSDDIRGFAEDRLGNIWIACYGGGITKLDTRRNEFVNHESVNRVIGSKYISTITADSRGNIWIGTWGQGVFRLDPGSLKIKHYDIQSAGFGDNRVFCIYEDKTNNIWVGSVGSGVFLLDERQDRFQLLNESDKPDHVLKTAYVTSILEDSDSTIWLGSLYGLYALHRDGVGKFKYTWYNHNRPDKNINSFNIRALAEGTGGSLWVGTGDNGMRMTEIARSPLHKFRSIQKVHGLPSNMIRAVVSDAKGNLWIATNNGLSRFNPESAEFKNYTRQDGLTSNEFNQNACLRASDGKLYFGTDHGLASFHPDSIYSNTSKPLVYLTDLRINNQSVKPGIDGSPLSKHISLTSEIELSHNQRSFVIDFVAVNFGQSSHNQYCYQLSGFDKDWNCEGSVPTATYTNLDPGHYTFMVKAVNNDGVWSETPATIGITLHPAPWNTWWARLSYLVLVAGAIYLIMRVKLERARITNQLKLERLAREKEHELSESKTQFFTNISHEFRTPLSLILLPLESLLVNDDFTPAVRDRLITVHKSADKMMRLVSELMDFNKLESSEMKLHVKHGEIISFIRELALEFNDLAIKKGIQFTLRTSVTELHGWFDHDKLEKVFANVLSNAFKFTAEHGTIAIEIDIRDAMVKSKQINSRHLILRITDNGLGISATELPYIFDKFFQAKSSTKVSNPGTGIGLSLAKGLVECHNGSIRADSVPNQETKFTIEIPIDRKCFEDDEILESAETNQLAEVTWDIMDTIGEISAVESNDRPRILVVEDNTELRKYVALHLGHQFEVFEAADGHAGLEIACRETPDLIISDVLMPVQDGVSFCRAIKSDIKTSHIPFIFLTAKTTIEDQITGVETGADVYITKPFSFRFLLAQVRQIIQCRQQLYARFSQDVYLLPGKATSNEIDQAFLQRAIDYVIANIQDPQLGVDSMAELFNLSRVQIYRKIKALTGKTVVEFIRMVRLKQALELMETKKYTLSEVAFRTGFNSPSYFTRSFKEAYGRAPSEYLTSH